MNGCQTRPDIPSRRMVTDGSLITVIDPTSYLLRPCNFARSAHVHSRVHSSSAFDNQPRDAIVFSSSGRRRPKVAEKFISRIVTVAVVHTRVNRDRSGDSETLTRCSRIRGEAGEKKRGVSRLALLLVDSWNTGESALFNCIRAV